MNETLSETAADASGTIALTEFKTESFVPNISVWLVDDNDGFRSALAEVLGRQRGIQCARGFSCPDAAVSALASQVGPDVILLDVHMRDRCGLDAIGPIKVLSRNTQVLILTTFFDSEGHNRALAEGASDFLLKSYSVDEIAQRIRNPERRVNARPRRLKKPTCPSAGVRTTSLKINPAPKSLIRGGLKLFRNLIG